MISLTSCSVLNNITNKQHYKRHLNSDHSNLSNIFLQLTTTFLHFKAAKYLFIYCTWYCNSTLFFNPGTLTYPFIFIILPVQQETTFYLIIVTCLINEIIFHVPVVLLS